MHIHRVFCLVLSLFSPVFSDEAYFQSAICCVFSGPDLEDTECIQKFGLNYQHVLEYNSTRGNEDGSVKKLICEDTRQLVKWLASLSTTPTVKIKLVKQPSGGYPAMLVCSAYNFFPKQVRITWLRNKQEVTTGVTYSDVMADGDLTYQMHVYLEYTPSLGENITCMVEHASLSEPKIVAWDNSLHGEAQIQITVGLCGLIFGLIILSSGFIYYRKKSGAYITFCRESAVTASSESDPAADLHLQQSNDASEATQTLIPVEHIPAVGATEQLLLT
ncbi:HLA class II histocompatibility antigen, DQ beta 1 chain-like isoform X2 [Melanotaenia boesemani]|uniref:HLA class II histocompatibility antigen, DQ beta 1 chain-like isoform X2 n=1 Tax=Melanotaenia boesemani TaxID=1250792 RepID=UPI001C0473A2|nr:HLA class II histocompatibility antigen, DQ beta 1 chain-like isoform X2 [Melanotaenia boesemani]